MSPTYDKFESRHSSQSEDLETLLPESETQSTDNLTKRPRKSSRLSRCGLLAAIVASFFGSMLFGIWVGSVYFTNPAKFCTGLVQNYGKDSVLRSPFAFSFLPNVESKLRRDAWTFCETK